jgi:hypothetical protein
MFRLKFQSPSSGWKWGGSDWCTRFACVDVVPSYAKGVTPIMRRTYRATSCFRLKFTLQWNPKCCKSSHTPAAKSRQQKLHGKCKIRSPKTSIFKSILRASLSDIHVTCFVVVRKLLQFAGNKVATPGFSMSIWGLSCVVYILNARLELKYIWVEEYSTLYCLKKM